MTKGYNECFRKSLKTQEKNDRLLTESSQKNKYKY